MSLQLYHVEFVGGPFDGHVHDVWTRPEEVQRFVSLPVNRRTVSASLDLRNGLSVRATSVAHYELLQHKGIWRYYFLGASRPAKPAHPSLLSRLMGRLKALGRVCGVLPSCPQSGGEISKAAS